MGIRGKYRISRNQHRRCRWDSSRRGRLGLRSGRHILPVSFPIGLAILLTIAGAFDPPAAGNANASTSTAGVVAGFQVAMLAAALIGVLGFFIGLRLKDVKPPWASSGDWKLNEAAIQQAGP